MICVVCGDVAEGPGHNVSYRHICNYKLYEYSKTKKRLAGNRDGIVIEGKAQILDNSGDFIDTTEMTHNFKIQAIVKPKHEVKFVFDIRNDMNKQDVQIVGIQLAHPQPDFVMSDHPYVFGEKMHNLKKKTSVKEEISVRFCPTDIGQYEMPIVFTFHKQDIKKNLIIVRDMVVIAEEMPTSHKFIKAPYAKEPLNRAQQLVPSTKNNPQPQGFKIPPLLKFLFAKGLEEKSLETVKDTEYRDKLRKVLIETKTIIEAGVKNSNNYVAFFHHLLWWEEVIARINLKKYNMTDVALEKWNGLFVLEVPGLAEKRPSLLRGDRVFLQPLLNEGLMFECVIKNIENNHIYLSDLDYEFHKQHTPISRYNVRFIMSRMPVERSHEAVHAVFASEHHLQRLYPGALDKNKGKKDLQPARPPPRITKFWNELIRNNNEQRSAVEHIVAGTSGKAPYIVFGPPGTGKTMTIVEAIIQVVVQNKKHCVLVCTDSNMAADHIALMLLKYRKAVNVDNYIIRANSKIREWSSMPAELAPVSNGNSYETSYPVNNMDLSKYRIIVTTLLHAAKYASPRSQSQHKFQVSHLFVDEAAQSSEPRVLIPMTGLLKQTGYLVLAGDPRQLGPVCMSRGASKGGLGQSLLERLKNTCDLYESNPHYITMLRKNFRSDPDILTLPNKLFYGNELVALAPVDPLSGVSILGLKGGDRAVVFHALHSKEQRMGNAPSYFNEKELEMLKRYVSTLVKQHGVLPKDIGVIAPYIRQVYKMKTWLLANAYDPIEVGTVEAFQGKEKRVILVSTVRANCRLLDYDAKYGLGFLVDDKRFNVAITRAKAKLIIIGNPTCLTRDEKWRQYMEMCIELGCYHGEENQQLERTETLLKEVALTRFDKSRITEALKEQAAKEAEKKNVKRLN